MRGILGAVTIAVALMSLSGCATSTDTAATTATAVTTEAANGLPRDAKFDAYDLPNGPRVEASFDITDRHGFGLRASAQQDTIEMLRHIKAAYPLAQYVLVTGYSTVTDDYGNTARRAVLSANYERSTIDRINFDGITRSTIWDIRDGGGGLRSDVE